MAKIILDDLANLQNQQTACATINSNNAILETAIDNTLSRDGQAPNQMEANIDMDSNRVLNLPAPLSVDEPLRLQDLADFNDLGVINAMPAGGTTGQVLAKNSNTDYDVNWQSGSGTVTSVALSAPAEFSVTGSPVTTTGTLTFSKANQTANTTYAGPTGGAAAAPAFRALVAADLPTISLTGDVTGNTGATVIGVNKVTNAMLAQAADSTVKSNISGGAAVPSDNTITAVLDKQLGTTQGSVMYRNAGSWVSLTPGTAGQILQSGGAAANPSWLTASGSGTVTQVNTGGMITGGPITTTGTLDIDATIPPCGRITLTTATPVLSGSVTGATTVYYTPYIGNLVPIYNGSIFTPTVFAELSQATTDATKSPAAVAASSAYDLFVWNDAGTIRCTRGPAWTNVGARSAGTALTRVNGVLLNNASITNGPAASRGTYVGSIVSNGSSTIDYIFGGPGVGGAAANFGLWNMYNRITMNNRISDSTDSWAYTTANTWRAPNGSATMRATFMRGLDEDGIFAQYSSIVRAGAGVNVAAGVGVDTTTGYAGSTGICSLNTPNIGQAIGTFSGLPGIGQHFVSAIEAQDNATSSTYFGDIGAPTLWQSALSVEIRL